MTPCVGLVSMPEADGHQTEGLWDKQLTWLQMEYTKEMI